MELSAGHILVADSMRTPDGRLVACPAAPMIAGELRRRQVPVSVGCLNTPSDRLVGVTTLLPGNAVPLGVAAGALASEPDRVVGAPG